MSNRIKIETDAGTFRPKIPDSKLNTDALHELSDELDKIVPKIKKSLGPPYTPKGSVLFYIQDDELIELFHENGRVQQTIHEEVNDREIGNFRLKPPENYQDAPTLIFGYDMENVNGAGSCLDFLNPLYECVEAMLDEFDVEVQVDHRID